MQELRAHRSVLPSLPAYSSGFVGSAVSLCASVLLHLAVAGGITLALYTHKAGSGRMEADTKPVFITLVQVPAPVIQTPEIIQVDIQEPIERNENSEIKTEIATDPENAGSVAIPQKNRIYPLLQKQVEKKAPDTPQVKANLRTSSGASSAAGKNNLYIGGTGQAELQYQDKVRAAIESHRIYPGSARRRKIQGTAIIRIHVNRQGHILKHHFIKGSGHHILDYAVLEMIKAADPLPAIPPSLKKDTVFISIPVGFQLR